MLEICLLRHAPTAGNLEHRYIGSTDEALCPQGEELARRAADVWGGAPPSRVVASPRLRTLQTARILFPHATVEQVEGLEEMDFGEFEGKTYLELSDDPRYQTWVDSGCTARVPGGESQEVFCARVVRALSATMDQASAAGGQRVAAVVHGGTIMAAMSAFVQGSDYWDWRAPFCTGYRMRAEMTMRGWSFLDVKPAGLESR